MGFKFEFMDLLESFFIESQVSVSSFCSSINLLTPLIQKITSGVSFMTHFAYIFIIYVQYTQYSILQYILCIVFVVVESNQSVGKISTGDIYIQKMLDFQIKKKDISNITKTINFKVFLTKLV